MKSAPFIGAARMRLSLVIAVLLSLIACSKVAPAPAVTRNDAMIANVYLDMPLFLYPVADIIAFGSEHSSLEATVSEAISAEGFTSIDPTIDGKTVENAHRKHHYHQPSDDLSGPVDWGSAVRFARANARFGYAIAEEDARPTWNEGDFFGEKFGR